MQITNERSIAVGSVVAEILKYIIAIGGAPEAGGASLGLLAIPYKMKVSREIGIYQKTGEKLIANFILELPVNQIIKILNVDIKDDPDAYKEYDIDEKQYWILCELVPGMSNYKFENVFISYECYQLD